MKNSHNELFLENATGIHIDSRDVAIMLNLRHSDLMKKIAQISTDLRESNSSVSRNWVESTYNVEGNFKAYRCYLISKRGCEFLAHKTKGQKGVRFTEQYMNRFEQMESELKGINPKRTEKELLLLDLFSSDSITIANAHKQLIEMEKAPLIETIEAQKVDVEFANKVKRSNEDLYSVAEVAKILHLGYGQNMLFKKLREMKVLMDKEKHNEPYQKYVDKGYLTLIVEDRGSFVLKIPKFTGLGLSWISTLL